MRGRWLITGMTFVNWFLACLIAVVVHWRGFTSAREDEALALWVPFAVLGAVVVVALLRERVVIRDDGVLVANLLQRRRLVPWAQIVEVTTRPGPQSLGVRGVLRLRSGEEIRMNPLRCGGSVESPRKAPLVEHRLFQLAEALDEHEGSS